MLIGKIKDFILEFIYPKCVSCGDLTSRRYKIITKGNPSFTFYCCMKCVSHFKEYKVIDGKKNGGSAKL